MKDLVKTIKAISMLSKQLHISPSEAQGRLVSMNGFRLQVNQTQQEAAVMVDEMQWD
ncbi:MAG: hypothetical protein Q8933_09415 [Bacteroidota bacterium]|nr:hypothetical protein [Bacteroidota bacterium]